MPSAVAETNESPLRPPTFEDKSNTTDCPSTARQDSQPNTSTESTNSSPMTSASISPILNLPEPTWEDLAEHTNQRYVHPERFPHFIAEMDDRPYFIGAINAVCYLLIQLDLADCHLAIKKIRIATDYLSSCFLGIGPEIYEASDILDFDPTNVDKTTL